MRLTDSLQLAGVLIRNPKSKIKNRKTCPRPYKRAKIVVILFIEVFRRMRLVSLIVLFSTVFLLPIGAAVRSEQTPAQRAATAFEAGQNAHGRGDIGGAIRLYTDAINAEPSLFQAYY